MKEFGEEITCITPVMFTTEFNVTFGHVFRVCRSMFLLFFVILCLQKAERASKQVVTEAERHHVRRGNLDRIADEQRRIDAEKDAEVKERRGWVVCRVRASQLDATREGVIETLFAA